MSTSGTSRATRPSRVLWAISAQMSQAVTSLVLHVIAARRLGSAGLAEFATLTSGLVVVAAVTTALVSDPMTLLSPSTPTIRAGLTHWAMLVGVGAIVAGALGAWVLVGTVGTGDAGGAGGAVGAGVVAGAVAATAGLVVATETLRRLVTLRRGFAIVTIVDMTGAIITVGAALHGPHLLQSLLVAMLAGRAVSLVVLVIWLTIDMQSRPRVEGSPYRLHRWPPWHRRPRLHRHSPSAVRHRADLSAVWRIGRWRLVQHALRPTMWTVIRVIAIASVGAAAWGQIESARLVVAPAMVVASGAGMALFVSLAHQRSMPPSEMRRCARRSALTTLILQLASIAGVAIALAAWAPLSARGAAEASAPSALAAPAALAALAGPDAHGVGAWTALALATGATTPAGIIATTAGSPAHAARSRTAEVLATLIATALLLSAGAPPVVVPWLAAACTAAAGIRLWYTSSTRSGPPVGAPW